MRPILDHTISIEEISRLIGVKFDLDPYSWCTDKRESL